jgi:hypothetical protein
MLTTDAIKAQRDEVARTIEMLNGQVQSMRGAKAALTKLLEMSQADDEATAKAAAEAQAKAEAEIAAEKARVLDEARRNSEAQEAEAAAREAAEWAEADAAICKDPECAICHPVAPTAQSEEVRAEIEAAVAIAGRDDMGPASAGRLTTVTEQLVGPAGRVDPGEIDVALNQKE